MLPGVHIEPYYDRTELIDVTTETVQENLFLGMVLVTVILLMFLSNVRSALIVAINIPLALLFAFSVLFLRGKSANLLSIGAVDFGIIVDSSVIMVENIYRHISSGENAELPLKDRILRACTEVENALFFSTLIMVCAFIPLFTMQGPEGQIFGPMADTYAFALGGALLLALPLAPVLCLLFFKHLKPAAGQFPGPLAEVQLPAAARPLPATTAGLTLVVFAGPDRRHRRVRRCPAWAGSSCRSWKRATCGSAAPSRSTSRWTASPRTSTRRARHHDLVPRGGDGRRPGRPARRRHRLRPATTTSSSSCRCGRKRSGRPVVEQTGWRRWLCGGKRPRTKAELIDEMNAELRDKMPGVDWNFSQNIRDNVMESLSGVKGDNSVKIFGPDLEKLEELAEKVQGQAADDHGHRERRRLPHQGQTNLEFRVDLEKCKQVGRQRRRRQQRHPDGAGRQGLHDDDRRGEDVRHHRALAGMAGAAARRRSWTSRWTSTNNQVVLPTRPGADPQPDRHRPGARRRRSAARPTPATRSPTRRGCGCATWCRRWARTAGPTPTAVSSAPAPRRSTASRASA